eukprot:TRINITY_DN707_c0_g1_i2.p1 TRINITY_DN707_c0_g1~~TRINITY_DN707_c0_g1_i2.p1  ORF type:complete len:105 (+),score=13.02 TRINITY_DN707_c0_g1_i2:209-523(+)
MKDTEETDWEKCISFKFYSISIKRKPIINVKLLYGIRIIDQLVEIGHALGCYKIILDCSEKNVTFYNKCGFKKKEIQMVLYIDDNEENGISKFNQYQPKIRSRL